jgi:hypothetical protein
MVGFEASGRASRVATVERDSDPEGAPSIARLGPAANQAADLVDRACGVFIAARIEMALLVRKAEEEALLLQA